MMASENSSCYREVKCCSTKRCGGEKDTINCCRRRRTRRKASSSCGSANQEAASSSSTCCRPPSTTSKKDHHQCEMIEHEKEEAGRRAKKASDKCFDKPYTMKPDPCHYDFCWQNNKYASDECGSGIVTAGRIGPKQRKEWCKTPLTMYQATIGELGRKVLCKEEVIVRNVNREPPCNVCEYVLPPCRGYYRKYDCIRPCEEKYVLTKNGRKVYRDAVERYWDPCVRNEQTIKGIKHYASHNAYLASVLKRRMDNNTPCW